VNSSDHTITALDDAGLIAVLVFGMHVAQVDLRKCGVRSHGHGQDTLGQ
jgi:hypothetical protein